MGHPCSATRTSIAVTTRQVVACVASVSVGFGSKERVFWYFARAENGEREPKMKYGVGEGKEGTLADKTLDFENLCSPANGAREWLG